MVFTARDHGNNQRRAERRIAGFLNSLLILAGLSGPFFQQLAEALAAVIGDNKEAPRLQGAMIRGAQPGAQNVFQLFAGRGRFRQAGSAAAIKQ